MSSKMLVVGLTGAAGAGKDTFAKRLKQHLGMHASVSIFSFADPLRAMLNELTHDFKYLERRDNRETETLWGMEGASYRQLMQTLGTEWGRNLIHEQLWVRHMSRRISHRAHMWETGGREYSVVVIIPDVRFANEAEFIKNTDGGQIIHIDRPTKWWVKVRDHISEQCDLSDFTDMVVVNNGTPADLDRLAKVYAYDLAKLLITDKGAPLPTVAHRGEEC